MPYAYPVVRYFNLALLLPIGCFAAFMAWEPSARLRTAAIVVFVLWGAANLVDNVRVHPRSVRQSAAESTCAS